MRHQDVRALRRHQVHPQEGGVERQMLHRKDRQHLRVERLRVEQEVMRSKENVS